MHLLANLGVAFGLEAEAVAIHTEKFLRARGLTEQFRDYMAEVAASAEADD